MSSATGRTPSLHADAHAADGTDPITPASLGVDYSAVTGSYLLLPGTRGTQAIAVNTATFYPFLVPRTLTLDRLACEVTTAATAASGGVVRMAIFDAKANGDPGVVLAAPATISSESTGAKEATIALTLTPGLYWLAAVTQVAAATVRIASSLPIPLAFAGPAATAVAAAPGGRFATVSGAFADNPSCSGTAACHAFTVRVA